MKRCKYCKSDKTIEYKYKPPRQREGAHKCDESCHVKGTMCLNCRMVW